MILLIKLYLRELKQFLRYFQSLKRNVKMQSIRLL